MPSDEGRLEVVLTSPRLLVQYMNYRGHSVRSLTDAVNRRSKIHYSKSTLGHLRSGHRKVCNPELARAIEQVLDAPAGGLFTARISNVQRTREVAP